jgi:hypothetical protein
MSINNDYCQNSPSSFHQFLQLPNEVQCEIISFCDFRTKLNLTETCLHLNDLLFSTPKLIERVQLKIDCYKDDENESAYILTLMEKLFTISRNGRQYVNLWLFRLDDALFSVASSLLYRILRDVGANVKELHILCGTFQAKDLFKVLNFFTNVEKIKVQNGKLVAEIFENEIGRNFLPKLTELSFKYSTTTMPKVFRGVKTLKTLKFKTYLDDFKDELEEFEDFLCQQHELKALVLHGAAFAEYRKILKVIMGLSDIETLEVFKVLDLSDLLALGNVSNTALKTLKYRGNENSNTEMLQCFVRIFPNLQSINFSLMTIFSINYEMLENLTIMKGSSPKGINYQPAKFHIDRETSETNLQQFILQQFMIMNLTVGDESWIGKDMGFSTQMWIPILQTCYLHNVKIYNPLKVDELVTLFATSTTRFYSVEIYTTAEGNQLIGEIELPAWLKVYVI